MKSLLVAASAAAALLAVAPGATAAQFVTWSAVAADGAFSGNFGDTGITTPTFTDVFDFALPTGVSSFTVNSTFSGNQKNNIDFTKVTFNGQDFTTLSQGQNEFRVLNGAELTLGAMQHLVVSGTSGGGGSYDGVISFTPVIREGLSLGVPEPASWALMILGFGGVGAMVRARRRSAAVL